MKKLLLVLLMVLWAVTAQAKTAIVEYAYTGDSTDTVAVFVSEMPDFELTLQSGDNVVGAIDVNKDGIIEIGNLVAGKTYYFSPVAWDINNTRTPFGASMSIAIPSDPPFVITEYPPIAIEGRTITFSVTVQ